MTVFQLKAVLATANLKSISAAAKALGVSQPNASNSIQLLEKEIGFAIFNRASGGASLTKKGLIFLDHARQIVEENDRIMKLKDIEETYQLRLGCLYYYPAVNAFLTLCKEHRDDVDADFNYYSVSIEEGINMLSKRALDIVVVSVMKHQISGLNRACKQNNIHLESLFKVPAVINVRKDHPALLDGRCSGLTQGSPAMKDFPYVTYRNLSEDLSSTSYRESDFVQCSYKIHVDAVDMKLRLISASNAFSFGILSSRQYMDQFGIASVPVPGITLEIFSLTRPSDAGRREIQEFISLFSLEMDEILKEQPV